MILVAPPDRTRSWCPIAIADRSFCDRNPDRNHFDGFCETIAKRSQHRSSLTSQTIARSPRSGVAISFSERIKGPIVSAIAVRSLKNLGPRSQQILKSP